MADYSVLIAKIEARIRENGNNEITGPILQEILKEMLRDLNATKADTSAIPTRLDQLAQSVSYRTVSDTEKTTWNAKSRAEWSDPHLPALTLPVDGRVTLTVTNGNTATPYTLALAEHTHARIPTAEQIAAWDAKSDFSGDYNDLTNKPDVPVIDRPGGAGNPIYFLRENNQWKSKLTNHLAIHPEADNPFALPFLFSDISFLEARGGSCVISGSGFTGGDKSALFDNSPSYSIWDVQQGATPSMVIQIHTPAQLNYSSIIYIDFGNTTWMARTVRLQWGNGDYNNDAGTQVISESFALWKIDASSTGLRDLQITLTDWQGTEQIRISEIGLLNFNGLGQRMTAMSRGIDDPVWRSITPAGNKVYDLGSSAAAWRNLYVAYLRALDGLYTSGIFSETSQIDFYVTVNGSLVKVAEMHDNALYFGHLWPLLGSTYDIGAPGRQWASLYLAQVLYLAGYYFITQWTDDIVLNQYNGGAAPVKRMRYCGALIQNYAHSFWDNTPSLLLTLGTEHISYRDFRPSANTLKLGTNAVAWAELHATRWYPVEGNLNIYVEYSNGRFLFNGNVSATGYITAGELGAATADQYMQYSIYPFLDSLKFGSSVYKWLEGWFVTLFAQHLGTSQQHITDAYIDTIHAQSIDVPASDVADWNFADTPMDEDITLADFGATAEDIAGIKSGKISKITDGEGSLLHIIQVEGTETGDWVTIYFGRNRCIEQVGASTYNYKLV